MTGIAWSPRLSEAAAPAQAAAVTRRNERREIGVNILRGYASLTGMQGQTSRSYSLLNDAYRAFAVHSGNQRDRFPLHAETNILGQFRHRKQSPPVP